MEVRLVSDDNIKKEMTPGNCKDGWGISTIVFEPVPDRGKSSEGSIKHALDVLFSHYYPCHCDQRPCVCGVHENMMSFCERLRCIPARGLKFFYNELCNELPGLCRCGEYINDHPRQFIKLETGKKVFTFSPYCSAEYIKQNTPKNLGLLDKYRASVYSSKDVDVYFGKIVGENATVVVEEL